MQSISIQADGQAISITQTGLTSGHLVDAGKAYDLTNIGRKGNVVTAKVHWWFIVADVELHINPTNIQIIVTNAGPENQNKTYPISASEREQAFDFADVFPEAAAA